MLHLSPFHFLAPFTPFSASNRMGRVFAGPTTILADGILGAKR